MSVHFSEFSKSLLEFLLRELEVTDTQYENAETAYKSLGEWLQRGNSTLRDLSPEVYVQGSFRLGTAIKPIAEEDDLDIDLVCEVIGTKGADTQYQIKTGVGIEIQSYADGHGIQLDELGKRCWTLLYADDRKFHMDVLPSIPDGASRRALLEQSELEAQWSDTAIAITDTQHHNFRRISDDWPHSNPKGYSEWFKSRGGSVFESYRSTFFERAGENIYASVEDIPQNRVKAPLQGVIQLLKRHRDSMFQDRKDDKPISIILSTLVALSYEQEENLTIALFAILSRMDRFIEDRDGVTWISNPVDPLENFADKWEENSKLEVSFYEWLEAARDDFEYLAGCSSAASVSELFRSKFGDRTVSSAINKLPALGSVPALLLNEPVDIRPVPAIVEYAPQKQTPPWPEHPGNIGKVEIVRATAGKSLWRSSRIRSNDEPIPKNYSLRFKVKTTIQKPYQVFWQVVNTGPEEESYGEKGLRGGLDDIRTEEGGLLRKESTSYTGSHSIECFIVKDGYLAARSGVFVVNII